MRSSIGFVLLAIAYISCTGKMESQVSTPSELPIVGTWKLLTATVIEKGDTTVTDFTKNVSFIKIITDTHFAFFQHDLNKGTDSLAVFASGAGTYSLLDSLYTERLEYCSAREWEGNDFTFTMTLKSDTLIQSGIEIVESAGVNRVNTETYIRLN